MVDRKFASWSAIFNPDPQSITRRPTGFMVIIRQATTALIAAMPTLILCSGTPPADPCPSHEVWTDNSPAKVPLQTRSLTAPRHISRKPHRSCFAKRVSSRISEPASRSVGSAKAGPLSRDLSTCPRTGSWPDASIWQNTRHRQGSPQGSIGTRGTPLIRAATFAGTVCGHGLQDANSAHWTGPGTGSGRSRDEEVPSVWHRPPPIQRSRSEINCALIENPAAPAIRRVFCCRNWWLAMTVMIRGFSRMIDHVLHASRSATVAGVRTGRSRIPSRVAA